MEMPPEARAELAEFARQSPDAQGRLGGRDGKYVELLTALLAESAAWPKPVSDTDWPTFAGNWQRNKIAQPLADIATVAWRLSISNPQSLIPNPLLVGDLVLINDGWRILALRRNTGKPAWGKTTAIYRSDFSEGAGPLTFPQNALGEPQFTMTAFGNKLFASMRSPVNGQPQGSSAANGPGVLGLPGFGSGRAVAVEDRCGRRLGLPRLAGGRPARRIRRHAA